MNTIEDRKIAYQQRLINELEMTLKPQALKFQKSQQSDNELALLHGYSINDLVDKPKATAQIQWMTSIFTLYNERLLDISNKTPFESVGDKPHSFNDLYQEKWGSVE
jgi:hypothetical protein